MLKLIYKYFRNKGYLLKLKGKNIRVLQNVVVDRNCIFEGYNSLGVNNILTNCSIGLGTYTGRNVNLTAVKTGRFCSIASDVKNIVGRHPTSKFVSSHPSFFSTGKAAGFTFCDKQLFNETKYVDDTYFVTIGNDVWIGENVRIFDNVKIGNGAIIGANSLVTRDVEPYSISFGTPCKLIKYRFDKSEVDFLQKLEWWNWDISEIMKNHLMFADIEELKNKFNFDK